MSSNHTLIQRKLARIDEPLADLRTLRQSLLSSTFSGLGDLFDSAVHPALGPAPRRKGKLPNVVLGLGDMGATWVSERRERRRHEKRHWLGRVTAALVVAAAVMAAAWLLLHGP